MTAPPIPNGARELALRTARAMLDLGYSTERILQLDLIPADLREYVREELDRDSNFPLVPARLVAAPRDREDWLGSLDRSEWYYWPTLREFLVRVKGWSGSALRSLDDSSDQVLRQLSSPLAEQFDVRG